VWPVLRRERDAWLEPARCELGGEHFGRAWLQGRAMTREQALEFSIIEAHPREDGR
jgi:hypothetical protein